MYEHMSKALCARAPFYFHSLQKTMGVALTVDANRSGWI